MSGSVETDGSHLMRFAQTRGGNHLPSQPRPLEAEGSVFVCAHVKFDRKRVRMGLATQLTWESIEKDVVEQGGRLIGKLVTNRGRMNLCREVNTQWRIPWCGDVWHIRSLRDEAITL